MLARMTPKLTSCTASSRARKRATMRPSRRRRLSQAGACIVGASVGQAQHAGAAGGRDVEPEALQVLRLLAKVPGLDPMLARRQVEAGLALGVGAGEGGRVDHDDMGAHAVMDIAAQRGHAGFIEHDGLGRRARIELDVDHLDRRERVDMMPHGVEVRKAHRRTGLHDEELGGELPVALAHFGLGGARPGRAALDLDRHDGAGQRLAIGSQQLHGDRHGRGSERAQGGGKEGERARRRHGGEGFARDDNRIGARATRAATPGHPAIRRRGRCSQGG
mmetsp:Transcript_49618/g.116572  ORF Transcript_49618/g.116572 Transcript_49618/m.116572 type:complete len:276 (-) Transcript_49618:1622-2449(-)